MLKETRLFPDLVSRNYDAVTAVSLKCTENLERTMLFVDQRTFPIFLDFALFIVFCGVPGKGGAVIWE